MFWAHPISIVKRKKKSTEGIPARPFTGCLLRTLIRSGRYWSGSTHRVNSLALPPHTLWDLNVWLLPTPVHAAQSGSLSWEHRIVSEREKPLFPCLAQEHERCTRKWKKLGRRGVCVCMRVCARARACCCLAPPSLTTFAPPLGLSRVTSQGRYLQPRPSFRNCFRKNQN